MEFNNFSPNIKFTYEFIEASINFLDHSVKCQMVNFRPPCMYSPQIAIDIFTFNQVIPNTQKN